MTSSTGGGEGRWPFDNVDGGASAQPRQPAQPPAAPGATSWGPSGATPPPTGSSPASGFGVHAGARPTPGAGADGGTGAGTATGSVPPGSRRDAHQAPPGRRRPPIWLLVLIGVIVVGAVVGAVLLLTGQDEPEVLPAETITLPVPTPTIESIAREPGSPFFEALPSEVLQFALTEVGANEDLLVAGALEAYRLVYSDGGAATVTVLAGQWRDAAGSQARLETVLAQVVAEVGEVPEASDVTEPEPSEPADDDAADAEDGASATPTEEPLPSPEQGSVEVDGQEVGRYVFLPREDGTGTLWWTNSTVFVQLDGPWAQLRDVFTAYAL